MFITTPSRIENCKSLTEIPHRLDISAPKCDVIVFFENKEYIPLIMELRKQEISISYM